MVAAEERAFFFEQLDDDGVGFEDGEAFVGLGLASAEALGVQLAAGVVDVLDFGQVVALAGGEVVDAVGGCGVDGAGALVGGDVVGGHAEDACGRGTDAGRWRRRAWRLGRGRRCRLRCRFVRFAALISWHATMTAASRASATM